MTEPKPEQSNQMEETYAHGRRHHLDFVSSILGGVILILLGILLFLASQRILAWDQWWKYLIIGIGVILVIGSLVTYRRDTLTGFRIGRLIAGIVLIAVGVAFLLGAVAWWPLVLVLIGVGVIIARLLRPRKIDNN